MLVLTRKAREQIQIGEHIVITILKVKGQTVQIGIEAPREVRVLRAELPHSELPSKETVPEAPASLATPAPAVVQFRASLGNSPVHRRRGQPGGPIFFGAAPAPLAARLGGRRLPMCVPRR